MVAETSRGRAARAREAREASHSGKVTACGRAFNPRRPARKQHRPPLLAGGCRVLWLVEAAALDADDVRGVQALLAGADLELHLLSFGEGLEPLHADGG